MKKQILLSLATCAVFASCSNDELLNVNTDSAGVIGFSTHVDKSTRSTTDITTTNIGSHAKGFAVYGYTNTGEKNAYELLFDNESVTGNQTDGYTYNNIQYWEAGRSYRFHAIAPYGYDTADDADALCRHWTLTTAPKDPEQAIIHFDNYKSVQVEQAISTREPQETVEVKYGTGLQDLVYSFASVNNVSASGNSKVNFNFSHLLSRVKFRVEGVSNNPKSVSISVKDIKIKDVAASGGLTITNKDASSNVLANSESKTVSASTWSINSNRAESISFGAGSNSISTKEVTESSNNGQSTSVQHNTTDTDHRFLIPEAKTYTASVELELVAAVGTSGSHTYKVTKDVQLLPIDMKMGCSYVYVLSIDVTAGSSNNVGLEPIIFNTKLVEDWSDYETVVKPEEHYGEYVTAENATVGTLLLNSGEFFTLSDSAIASLQYNADNDNADGVSDEQKSEKTALKEKIKSIFDNLGVAGVVYYKLGEGEIVAGLESAHGLVLSNYGSTSTCWQYPEVSIASWVSALTDESGVESWKTLQSYTAITSTTEYCGYTNTKLLQAYYANSGQSENTGSNLVKYYNGRVQNLAQVDGTLGWYIPSYLEASKLVAVTSGDNVNSVISIFVPLASKTTYWTSTEFSATEAYSFSTTVSTQKQNVLNYFRLITAF
jgi:hypothetical protein